MALLLASCGSTDLGSILGGPQTSSSSGTSDLYGTVNSVDTRNQRIDLTVDDYNSTRNMTVYYDSRTRVTYQNQTGSPSQLERGDRVTVRMVNNGSGQAVADTITVTQSVSSSSTYPSGTPSGTYPSTTSTGRVTGTVNYIDTSARLINVNASYVTGLRTSSNNTFTIYYDTRTRVMYQGRTYAPEDLERGDQIDVTTYASSNGQYVADTINVTRNVRQ
jgi:hypothetical protein